MRHGWEVEHFGTPKSAADIGDAPGDSPTSPVMKSEGPGRLMRKIIPRNGRTLRVDH